MKDWDVLYIAECDGYLQSDVGTDLEFNQHVFKRHWPGAGAMPSAVVVHQRWGNALRHIEFRGRACRFDFSLSRDRKSVV